MLPSGNIISQNSQEGNRSGGTRRNRLTGTAPLHDSSRRRAIQESRISIGSCHLHTVDNRMMALVSAPKSAIRGEDLWLGASWSGRGWLSVTVLITGVMNPGNRRTSFGMPRHTNHADSGNICAVPGWLERGIIARDMACTLRPERRPSRSPGQVHPSPTYEDARAVQSLSQSVAHNRDPRPRYPQESALP